MANTVGSDDARRCGSHAVRRRRMGTLGLSRCLFVYSAFDVSVVLAVLSAGKTGGSIGPCRRRRSSISAHEAVLLAAKCATRSISIGKSRYHQLSQTEILYG